MTVLRSTVKVSKQTYHILTCVSVRLKLNARLSLSQTDRYRVVLNLFSNDTSCSYVKAVRALKNEIYERKRLIE